MARPYRIITKRGERERAQIAQSTSMSSESELDKTLVHEGVGGQDDNHRILAGFSFLGQFIGHDITNDSGLNKEPLKEPPIGNLVNSSSPALDLDGLYGKGLDGSEHLYDSQKRGKFLLGEGGFDLPRKPNSQPAEHIGDPRNDRNLILAQLHLAFLKFHNAVFEQVEKGEINEEISSGSDSFKTTQRLVRWHYQWIILREFLPLIVGSKMVLDVLTRILKNDPNQWYQPKPEDLFIPLEFSAAAYRFGHSQIHYQYRINDGIRLPLFSTKTPSGQRQDLQGGRIETEADVVDWKYFFNTEPNFKWVQESQQIKPRLAHSLLFPPQSVIDNRKQDGEPKLLAEKSLGVRDLERGEKRALPSGQEVAADMQGKGMGVSVLNLKGKKEDFDKALHAALLGLSHASELERVTPLWYFILKEAEVQYDGQMLGDVGGRIVAEVIINLLKADRNSLWGKVDLAHLFAVIDNDDRLKDQTGDSGTEAARDFPSEKERTWKPTLSSQRDGDFTIVDLLTYPSA